MKLTRWALSIEDETGNRVACGVEVSRPEIFETRARARKELRRWKQWDPSAAKWKPRVERVIIDIPGIEGKGE